MVNLKTLKPVHPNIGLEIELRRRINKLIDEMHRSIQHFIGAAYKANQPRLAADALPATELKRAVRKLSRRWQKRFNEASPKLAKYFTIAIQDRSDRNLKKILKDAGFSVPFKLTATLRDVVKASINQQVKLISNIPTQYLVDIEGAVMRSVQTGRDLEQLSDHMQKSYGMAKRRAALIARDQNNKATASIVRVRQTEAGITEAIWLHSLGGKIPRPRHIAFNGKRYDISRGAPVGDDDGNYVFPGEEINCRCVSRSIVPGFS